MKATTDYIGSARHSHCSDPAGYDFDPPSFALVPAQPRRSLSRTRNSQNCTRGKLSITTVNTEAIYDCQPFAL